jgi:hypothetical protein
MTNVNLRDLITNMLAGAIVTLATLLLKHLLPRFDPVFLSLIASIVSILLLLGIHYLCVTNLFTSEPVIIPLVVAMITILAIWILILPSPEPPTISISEPTQTVVCPPPPDLCIFPVRGTSKHVTTDSQTIVIFVDPGGGNWWPQNLDFHLEIWDNGDWEGKAQIGDKSQPSGTEFRIIALLMNRAQANKTIKRPYKELPPSITNFGPIRLIVLSTPVPTITPTEKPTPLVLTQPPTPTMTPQPTPTTTCPTAGGPFAVAWNRVQGTIGCADSNAITGLIVEENFEGGKLFWREPIDYAQILALFNDGTWQIVKHSPFIEGSPEFSCPDANTPSQCPPTPKRGFGIIWCDIPEMRARLGNALDCERGYQGSMQQFDRGFMLQTDSGAIYALYDDGRWERR